jgi:hypothetical protein
VCEQWTKYLSQKVIFRTWRPKTFWIP